MPEEIVGEVFEIDLKAVRNLKSRLETFREENQAVHAFSLKYKPTTFPL